MDKNHIVFTVMDSCRYDSFVAPSTPNIDRIGRAEKRYSHASWTAPSHSDHGNCSAKTAISTMARSCTRSAFEIPYVEGKLNEAVSTA